MKQRYPIGLQDFAGIRNDGYEYIDKTEDIYNLVNLGKYIFLSRPRRFGKSLLLSTMRYYFEGRKDLFKGLKIAELEKDWIKYPVLHLQLSSSNTSDPNSLAAIIRRQFNEWDELFGLQTDKEEDLSSRFREIVVSATRKTGQRAVVLIDEYDNPLINTLHNKEMNEYLKSLLKSIYSNLKDLDAHIRFVFITGVSRFTNTSIFSGLNNLMDVSMEDSCATICGFTEDEVRKYLWPGVENLAIAEGCNAEEALGLLKKEYDGYHFSESLVDIYNPFSLLTCLQKSKINNYWVQSGTPTFLIRKLEEKPLSYIEIFHGEATDITLAEKDTAFSSPIALMYQTGYLTIKGYDRKSRSYRLGIPNLEIETSLAGDLFQSMVAKEVPMTVKIVNEMREALMDGKPEEFFKRLKSFLAGIPGVINHRDMLELNFENIIYVLLLMMGADVRSEVSVASGRLDLLVSTEKYIYVIELKYNSTPKKALEQIEKKEYSLPYEYDGRQVFKIGANFSAKTRNLTGWKIQS